jgi:hypothetical protein
MKRTLLTLAILSAFFSSCNRCQYNEWTEKDCNYPEYYQSTPPLTDNQYYQSNLKR